MREKHVYTISAILILCSIGSLFVNTQIQHNIQASWSYAYSDVQELADKSDLIIKGKVISSVTLENEFSNNDLIFTSHTVEVIEVVKGYVETKNIEIYQTGGETKNVFSSVVDDPLFKEGDIMVLFLRKSDTVVNRYIVLGGPQGRFMVNDDAVYSMSEYLDQSDSITSRMKTNGISYADFINQIK